MAEGDFSVYAKIQADTTSFQNNIKQAQSSVTSLSNTFGGLSKVITKAFSFVGITASVGAVVKFGKESVKAAESANKSFNVLDNTIRATGASAWTTTENMVQMSKELADSTNYAVSEVQDMQSVLLGFRNITGDTFEEASEAIMDMATVMGMDLKSATQTVGKALDDPIKGLDSLRRQGFQFTEEQKEQLKQLVENGKQLEAQKIILDELATTYGGAAKAAQSSFARMRNATTELKETLGNQLMPVMNEIADNSTKMIKQLTSEIQKIDFSRMFGMVKNIANMIKPVFEDVVNYFKSFGDGIKDLFKSETIKPFVSILDTVLGVLKSLFSEIKANFNKVKSMFTTMKEGLGGLADGGALQNISNVINKIIDAIWFLKEQIDVVIEDVRSLVFDKIKAIWNYFKQLFNNSNKALEENEEGFASWAEFFWSQFDQVFRVAQDLINGVSALLHGDWAVAWEYAKLTAMRVAKVILDTLSQIANAFPKMINGAVNMLNKLIEELNKVRKFFGQEEWDLLQPFESVDLTESSGLGKAIADTEKKIKELTGKAADVSIRHLNGISRASKGMSKEIIGDITDVTDSYAKNTKKQHLSTSNLVSAIEEEAENIKTLYEKILEGFQNAIKKLIEQSDDWTSFADSTISSAINAYSEMFMLIGQGLVDNEVSFKNYASVVIKSIQDILKGLSAQLTALSAVNFATGQYGKAIKTGAAAAAALVSAGALGGVASKMEAVNSATTEANGSLEKFKENLNAIFSGDYVKQASTFSIAISQTKSQISEMRKEADRLYQIASQPYDMTYVKDSLGFLTQVKGNTRRNKEIDKASKEYEKIIKQINEATNSLLKTMNDLKKESSENVKQTSQLIDSYQDYYSSLSKLDEIETKLQKDGLADSIAYTMAKSGSAIVDVTKLLSFQLEKYEAMVETLKNEIKNTAQTLTTTMYESLGQVGKDIGELIFSSILNGADRTSFVNEMKSYIKKYVLQMAVYTESFTDRLSEIGIELVDALTTGKSVKNIKNEILKLYDETEKMAVEAEKIISEAFGDITDSIDESINSLSKFDESAKNLFETIGDLGGDIASQIIDGLTNGLSQSEFLDNMKKWIKNMMIQMVVYTDSVKAEVEAIGKKISQGLVNGFTDTDLNEIRRDLSYIFDQASRKVSTIDSMLEGVFAFKDGVNSAPRGLALVGEAGPELVNFRGGENVINNRNTQKLLADKTNMGNTFNVTFNNTQDTTAFAMVSQLKTYQRELAFNGVL